MDPNHGYHIHGLDIATVKSAEDLRKKLEYGRKSRKTQIFETGPANDSTAAVFEIILKQVRVENARLWDGDLGARRRYLCTQSS